MGNRTSYRRTLRIAIVVAAVAAFAPSPAHAGLLSTGSADGCDPYASQVFKPWGDDAYYSLVPGGAFEGTNLWTLKNGAKIVSGNEPFYVRSSTDTRSLALPKGSSAVSPSVCFEFADWHGRLFVRKMTKGSGYIKVEVIVRSVVGGVLAILDGGTISASGDWQPSGRVALLTCNLTSLTGTEAILFRFKAVGAGFQIDDVYLDPWKSS